MTARARLLAALLAVTASSHCTPAYAEPRPERDCREIERRVADGLADLDVCEPVRRPAASEIY